MNIIQTAELAGLNFIIGYLKTNGAQLEADLGPVETVLINDGIKIADAWFAKLPFGIGGLLNGLLEGYAGALPGEINQYVGIGISFVINYLTALAAKISAA